MSSWDKSQEYRWMPLESVLKYEPQMQKFGVSKVARGKRGFLTNYKKYKTKDEMPDYWRKKRHGFISRHLVQYRNNRTPRRKLALIAWAYNPD